MFRWDNETAAAPPGVAAVFVGQRRSPGRDYAVVLTVDGEDDAATVRVYDGAHGVNDMHRHGRDGEKAPAETFHAGTLGEGMRAAITAVRTSYKQMIDAWRAT